MRAFWNRSLAARWGTARLSLAGFVVTGMVGLIFFQLVWWLVFFEIRSKEIQSILSENDTLRQALANAGQAVRLPEGTDPAATLILRNGRFEPNPAVAEERARAHRRQRFMLISETVFLISVLIYGHYRIIRALRREWALVRDRNNLIQSVTHELKTPLAGALLSLQTLRKRETDPDSRNQILDEGIADLKRLENRINNLLTGSALLRGRGVNEAGRAQANAAALVRACLAEIAPQARVGRVEVILNAPDEFPVRIEPALLEKVVGNLILNAVQHSPPGGVVRVELGRDLISRKFGLLRVRDDGPGIPSGEREKVFQPLYRLESGQARGSGMGLYIVREILTAAGGTVQFVDVTGPGSLVEARMPIS